jgi:hypothetical protein
MEKASKVVDGREGVQGRYAVSARGKHHHLELALHLANHELFV